MRIFLRYYRLGLALTAFFALLLFLFACAHDRRRWNPNDPFQTGGVPYDYGAGKRPDVDATGYHRR